MGKPEPPSKEPIIIDDAPTITKEESPSKISITYKRGAPKTSTWKERIKLMDSKAVLQEAHTSLQETLAKIKETKKIEKKVEEQTQEEDKVKEIPEPGSQPNLGSYYNLLEGGKIIPQKFVVPLFFKLEKERVKTHTWMQIAKSKGVKDIGHMENKLREMSRELSMVRHTKSIRRAQLQEENEWLKKQLQEREPHGGNELSILKGQQQKEGPQVYSEAAERQQQEEEPQTNSETLMKKQQEKESQAETKVLILKRQLQEKEAQLACMASQEMEALQCRKPAKSYALYLKDQWLQFQIKTLAQRGTIPFQDYGQFMHLCDHSSAEDKEKLIEFYLYNMALTEMNLWDPNAALGDFQLMAMESWMNHEEKRAVEIQEMMEKELSEPLIIRGEPAEPLDLIYAHQHLAANPQVLLVYVDKQAHAIAHFEDMERLFGDDCIHACMRRWNTLPHNLRIREYHSQNKMREAMRRVPLYKHLMQNLKANWIGLKISPPLLLGLLEGVKEEEEQKQWEEVDRKVGFHDREEDITSETWDVRESVRAIKDEELDQFLRG